MLSRTERIKDNEPLQEVFDACLAAQRTLGINTVLRITIFFYKIETEWPTWLLMLSALLSRQQVRCSVTVLFDEGSIGRDTEFLLRDCVVRHSDLHWALVHVWLAPSWVDLEGMVDAPEPREQLCLDFHFAEHFGADIRRDDE